MIFLLTFIFLLSKTFNSLEYDYIDYCFNGFDEKQFVINSSYSKFFLVNSSQTTLYLSTNHSHVQASVLNYETKELLHHIDNISKYPLIDNGNQTILINVTNNNPNSIEIYAYSAPTQTCEKKIVLSDYNNTFTLSNIHDYDSEYDRNIALENGMDICILITYSHPNPIDSFIITYESSLSKSYTSYEYIQNNFSAFFHLSISRTELSKNFVINATISTDMKLNPSIIAYTKMNETMIYRKPDYLLSTFGLNSFDNSNQEILIQTTAELSSIILHNTDIEYECDIMEYNNNIIHFASNESTKSAYIRGLSLVKIRTIRQKNQCSNQLQTQNNSLFISFMTLVNNFASKCNILSITNREFSIVQEEYDLFNERNLTSYEFMDICIWSSFHDKVERTIDFNGEDQKFDIMIKVDNSLLEDHTNNYSSTFSSYSVFAIIHSTTKTSLSSFKLKQNFDSEPNVIFHVSKDTPMQLLTNQTLPRNATIPEVIDGSSFSQDILQLDLICFIVFGSLFLAILIVTYIYNCGKESCFCCFIPCNCSCCNSFNKESQHERSAGTFQHNTIDQSLYIFKE